MVFSSVGTSQLCHNFHWVRVEYPITNPETGTFQLQQQQQQFARMQQQHAQLAAARANGAYSVPAPPPGFNQVCRASLSII